LEILKRIHVYLLCPLLESKIYDFKARASTFVYHLILNTLSCFLFVHSLRSQEKYTLRLPALQIPINLTNKYDSKRFGSKYIVLVSMTLSS